MRYGARKLNGGFLTNVANTGYGNRFKA